MSDLTRLNPTPHAIAVYASQPLSPVATQHSLASRSYPLLGPDLHRLDRTSLRLAHLFDHLVGARKQRRRNFEAAVLRLITSSNLVARGHGGPTQKRHTSLGCAGSGCEPLFATFWK